MKIKIGDSIQTARGSKADVVLDDDSLRKNFIRIEPNTLVIINSTVPGELNSFDVSQGRIYANIENAKSGVTYEVSSPSSIAGVRGTGWRGDIERQRDEFSCFEREIYLKTLDENRNVISETTIPEGFSSVVERFAAAGPLIELTTQERQQWTETKADISQRIEQQAEKEKKKEEEKAAAEGQTTEEAQDVAAVVDQVEESQKASAEAIEGTKETQKEVLAEKIVEEIREGGEEEGCGY
jgi:hypothetical protein